MRPSLLAVVAVAGTVAACDASLAVLETRPLDAGNDDATVADASPAPEGGMDGAYGDDATDSSQPAESGVDAGDGWPGPPGTVVPIATGFVGAVDVDVDDAFAYVLVGGQDGGLWRVPKRGGDPEPIAEHQVFPTSVRATPRAVVWSLAPGDAPSAPTIMSLPRDGGAPTPLLVGGNSAGKLEADGDRVVWVDGAGGLGRVMIADLGKGSMRPILEDELGVGGFAFEGNQLVWSARCHANQCGGFVLSTPIDAPAPAAVWSTTPAFMLGIGLRNGTITFGGRHTSGDAFFARLPAGSSQEIAYPGTVDLVSTLRRDGEFFVGLSYSGSSVSLVRVRADGTAPPDVLSSSPGTTGASAPDAPAIYWISQEEGVLRAIAR